MSVSAIFNTNQGQSLSIENAIHARKTLHLKGKLLCDEYGLILAELVEDQEGRLFWKVWADVQPESGVGKSIQDPLYQEIVFVGQGRINL